MIKRLISKRHKSKSYFLGQEIKVSKTHNHNGYSFDNDPVGACKTRLWFALSFFILGYLVVCARVFDLCVIANLDKTPSVAKKDVTALHYISPIKRADIVDRHGTIIATSLPTVNLFVNPKKVIDVEDAAYKIQSIFPELSYDDILSKLKRRSTFVYIKRNLTPAQQHQINSLGIPGLDFENGEKRVYPHEELFAHVIGKANIDNVGISGVERELDNRLTQSDIPLSLTIDAGVQYTIREELKKAKDKFSAEGAVAILMEVDTGDIISMVSLPDYNPNSSTVSNEKALFNFATQGLYEPGSVFKVFNTCLALDSGKVKPTDQFDATKPIKVGYNTIKDYRGKNSWLSVTDALVHSSNIASTQMALKVGKEQQKLFLERIGLFSPLDIEIAERASPSIPRHWRESTIATVSYGYGVSVTPLHVITSFSAMVNGGIYHSPTLLKSSDKDEGKRVLSEKHSITIRKMLREVIIEGSGKRANILGYEVAGKTGTANKLVNGKYIDKKVFSTFIGTFPASNPKYALYVMLDEPKALKETWGFVTSGWNAVPTAGNIISAVAPQLNIKANYDIDELRKNRIIEASY